ncbi:hypothetical protein CPB86DRAFT_875329 [Serendipita vermifera]|nr:hypothetical protein CPB86DRAFT_875329 [Serendipita vermifera]
MPPSKEISLEPVDPLDDLIVSSPIRENQRSIAGHDRDEFTKHVIPKVTETVGVEDMWKLLEPSKSRKEEFERLYKNLHRRSTEKHTDYLTRLSGVLYNDEYRDKGKDFIRFIECPYRVFPHPTGSLCRADLVAVRDTKIKPIGEATSPQKVPFIDSSEEANIEVLRSLSWSHLETVGEIRSGGISVAASQNQGASYTGYLLQARPDLVSVVGIFVDTKEFRLAFSNACGIAYMKSLRWRSIFSGPILCAWIARIYEPITDPSMERNIALPRARFTLTHNDETSDIYEIKLVGIPFGRRTTVFEPLPQMGQDKIVVKYQYIEIDRRFSEQIILDRVHENGPFPGVVRINGQRSNSSKQNEVVVELEKKVTGDKEKVTRKRTRLEMLDKAVPLMDAETPLALLVALYDLLEVTRFLYRKRKVFHRDISAGNVLIRPEMKDYKEAEAIVDFDGMHFATFLLRRHGRYPGSGRLSTRLLLIDFDMAEDQTRRGKGVAKPRTGTPIFMARVVRSCGKIDGGARALYPMPQLEKGKDHYEMYLEDRLKMFPPNEYFLQRIDADITLEPFRHKLYYDAESVFWLLLYWCIQARPASRNREEILPRSSHWNNLTGGSGTDDTRGFFLETFPSNVCHPRYQALEGLLRSMADQLKGYPELTEDKVRNHQEYLHEAFQRLIFEFISANSHESFIVLKTSTVPRRIPRGNQMTQPLSSSQRSTRSTRSTYSSLSTVSNHISLRSVEKLPDISNYSKISSDVEDISNIPKPQDSSIDLVPPSSRSVRFSSRKKKRDTSGEDEQLENQPSPKKARKK